jgi:hypothetical protein
MFSKTLQTFRQRAAPLLQRGQQLQTQKTLFQSSKRQFSGKASPNPGFGSMAMLGVGTAGLIFLMWKGRSMMHDKNIAQYGAQQQSFMHPVVQQRMRETLGYFGAGIAMTGLAVSRLRFSKYAYANPWLMLFGTMGLMMGTHMVDYQN